MEALNKLNISNKLKKINPMYLSIGIFFTFALAYYLNWFLASKYLILLFVLSCFMGSLYSEEISKETKEPKGESVKHPIEKPVMVELREELKEEPKVTPKVSKVSQDPPILPEP